MATIIPVGSESLKIVSVQGEISGHDTYHPELVAIGMLSLRLPSLLSQPHDASICFGGTSALSLQCLRTLTLGKSMGMVAQW
jgi:hypothetical protein